MLNYIETERGTEIACFCRHRLTVLSRIVTRWCAFTVPTSGEVDSYIHVGN